MRPILAGLLAAALVSPSVASADTIFASGPVYAGQTGGDQVACRFFNASGRTVTFTDIAVIASNNSRVNINGNNCGGPIPSQHGCVFTAASPGNIAFVCYGAISGTGALSGTAELRTSATTYVTQPIIKQQ